MSLTWIFWLLLFHLQDNMESSLILLLLVELLFICACSVPAENVGEVCEQQQDGIVCADTLDDESQKTARVHKEMHAHDRNIQTDHYE